MKAAKELWRYLLVRSQRPLCVKYFFFLFGIFWNYFQYNAAICYLVTKLQKIITVPSIGNFVIVCISLDSLIQVTPSCDLILN